MNCPGSKSWSSLIFFLHLTVNPRINPVASNFQFHHFFLLSFDHYESCLLAFPTSPLVSVSVTNPLQSTQCLGQENDALRPPKTSDTLRNTESQVCVLSSRPVQFSLLLTLTLSLGQHIPFGLTSFGFLQTLSVIIPQGFCTFSSLCLMLFPKRFSFLSLFKGLHFREIFLTILPNGASHSLVFYPLFLIHFSFFLQNTHHSPSSYYIIIYIFIYLLSVSTTKMPALWEQNFEPCILCCKPSS